MGAAEAKETTMHIFTLAELFRLTRAELFDLHGTIVAILNELPEGSEERSAALQNLRNIRKILARPELTPD
jgi:hypothetical protein